MRATYETLETLTAERAFMQRYESAFGCRCEKLPRRYSVDCAIMQSGTVTGWLELKCRTHTINRYPGYWLSLAKFFYGCSLSERTGAPFVLAVAFSDCDARLVCSALRRDQWGISFGGRYDRGDPEDCEPLAVLPINLFTTF